MHVIWKNNIMILRKEYSGPRVLKLHIILREIFEDPLIK